MSLLQFIASGAFGKSSFQGGQSTAMAGLLFHYLITGTWAAVYFFWVGQRATTLMELFAVGALYGVVIHLMMSLVVVRLSRTPKRPFIWKAWLIQLPIHIALVGLPIALIQSWLRRG